MQLPTLLRESDETMDEPGAKKMNRMLRNGSLAMLAAVVFTACTKNTDQAAAQATAEGIANTIASTSVATDKACKLFTRAEIATALGAAVEEGTNWAPGGCEWRAGDTAVHITIARAEDWEPQDKSAGGESLQGIGKQAFVGPWLGDSRAGALTDSNTVYVLTPSRDVSVALLRKAVERLPPP